MDKKLGVIVPYRDRHSHLIFFQKQIAEYLSHCKIPFELIIVEQCDTKPFNRGKLLNIGFIEAEKRGCDYVVFHDVDMLPIDVDYSYSDIPIHLATNIANNPTYFGGVTIFPNKLFKDINGFPNEYWGWGFEDDELLRRCTISDTLKFRNRKINKPALHFKGNDSYVKISNTIDYKKSIKICVTFEVLPDMVVDLDFDEWTIFSIPGWDLTLTYNSFGRYKFELWDYKRKCYSINSNVSTPHLTNFVIEILPEECVFKVTQDRLPIGEESFNKLLFNYSKEDYIYLGNANPYRGTNMKPLNGVICDFKIWNDSKLIIDYDFKSPIEYYNCDSINTTSELYKTIKIPHNRISKFEILNHNSNGFSNGNWVDSNTRKNQIKFNKQLDETGLNDIDYTILNSNDTHLKVTL
jgi:hypothetical protein